jgi:nucleoside-diphosphate-sugar epimerase
MPETVLVTGGSGFIASWCIIELLRQGYEVRTTVRSLSKEQTVREAISETIDPGDRLTFFAADLKSDAGWDTAVAGCDYVLHVASPLGGDDPKDPNSMIAPARDGTLRVVAAAAKASVKRVVMTSSGTAASPPTKAKGDNFDETIWTDIDGKNVDAYWKSKVLAERAAWQFIEDNEGATTLATVLPGLVLGPVPAEGHRGSVRVIESLLNGELRGIPQLGFNIVDVRDLADLHLRAMTSPTAAGQRFLAVSEFLWMADIAKELRSKLGTSAAKVPTRVLPNFLLRALSLVNPLLRRLIPTLGRRQIHTSEKAQRLLEWRPRPAASSIVDCAESLIN